MGEKTHLKVHLLAVLGLWIISHDLHQQIELPSCHEIIDVQHLFVHVDLKLNLSFILDLGNSG